MVRSLFALVLVAILGPTCAWAQSQSGARRGSPDSASVRVNKEAFLGLRFALVPDVLYDHLPKLTRGAGLVVETIKADSPAEQAGLKRHDILLSYNGKDIKDGEQFANLLRSDRAERKAALVLLRGGKELTLDVGLAQLARVADNKTTRNGRGSAKKGQPPAVSCEATPIGGGKMEVTFEYYPEGKGKLLRVKYSGSLEEIAVQVRQLPMPVQDLARVALDRLRARKYR
jgi:hypothetical protein